MEEAVKVRCPGCNTLNRLPASRLGEHAKCGQCGAALPAVRADGRPFDVTDADFRDAVIGSPLPVLVEFWSPSCGHCIRMHPVMDEVARTLKGRLAVAKMDVSANPRTPFDYGVMGTPAFVVIKGGRIAEQFVGAMSGAEVMRKVERHV